MKRYLLLLICLPLLAGCHYLTQQPLTPPVSLNVQQRVEWSVSKCVLLVKEERPWYNWFVPCRCAWRSYYVTIISPDGTALASFRDAIGKTGYSLKGVSAKVRRIYTERATKKLYYIQASDGDRYPYRVTSLAPDCESAILKPVNPIPPQPYIDLSRMAAPMISQRYLGAVSPLSANQPVPIKIDTITVKGVFNKPVSASTNLLFRDSDGSFAGFCNSTDTSYTSGKWLVPLQRFIEANSTVRFINTTKLKTDQSVRP